jgi:hypothetical protein
VSNPRILSQSSSTCRAAEKSRRSIASRLAAQHGAKVACLVATAGPNLVDLEVSRKRIPAQPKVKALPVGMMPSAWKDRKGRLRGSSAAAATACDVVRYCTARRGTAALLHGVRLGYRGGVEAYAEGWSHEPAEGYLDRCDAKLEEVEEKLGVLLLKPRSARSGARYTQRPLTWCMLWLCAAHGAWRMLSVVRACATSHAASAVSSCCKAPYSAHANAFTAVQPGTSRTC